MRSQYSSISSTVVSQYSFCLWSTNVTLPSANETIESLSAVDVRLRSEVT